MHHKQQYIVLTGGPGSGKTSVINAIEARGVRCAVEVGRQVIQSEMLKGGQALPWVNKTQFRDRMLKEELSSYQNSSFQNDSYQSSQHVSERIFFDRGIIDCYGYSVLENLALTKTLVQACQRNKYHDVVFIFPPWKAIYANDLERKQDFDEAVRTYQTMSRAYSHFGYTLVEVPFGSVEDRVNFIFTSLRSMSPE